MTNISNALKVAEQKSIMKFQWKHQDKQTQNSKLPDQNGGVLCRILTPRPLHQKQLSQIEYIKGKGNGKREYLNRVAAICESHGATISPLA